MKTALPIVGEAHWRRLAGDFDIRMVRRSGIPGGSAFLGPRKALMMAMPPAGSLEPAYLKEIDRRSTPVVHLCDKLWPGRDWRSK